MEREVSLHHSQKPATCAFFEPHQFIPRPTQSSFFKPPLYAQVFKLPYESQAVARLVDALSYKIAGSFPDYVIGIFN
jgi:hypothetical protein